MKLICTHKRIGPEPCSQCDERYERRYKSRQEWDVVDTKTGKKLWEVLFCEHPGRHWKRIGERCGLCLLCGAEGSSPGATEFTDICVEVPS